MLARQVIAVIIISTGLTAPVLGQPSQGITAYPATFFTEARPVTAQDMINRLPGFTLDTGSSARGFTGAAGNVLIDGARPTAKTDELNNILSRIPAASVERIDVIRGGAPGIDMQGKPVVANIVRKAGARNQIVLTAGVTVLGAGQWFPDAGIQYYGQSGAIRYEATFTRTMQVWDDGPGNGYRTVAPPGGPVQRDLARLTGVMRPGFNLHGGIIAPLWGGEWNNNFTIQTGDYVSSFIYSGGGGSRFDYFQRRRNGEAGSHWQGDAFGMNLETLLLQRLGHEETSNSSATPGSNAVFAASNDSGESIARATARYSFSPTLGIETGGEAAYNFLRGRTSYVANGTATALPNANVSVNEKRAEIFANVSWKIDNTLALDAGARTEYSVIAQTGDIHSSRSFFFPKPRLLLTWSPDSQSQLRLRAERTVSQLNFSDFVASSNLAGFGVAAGGANLRPETRWQMEATAERRFWGRGALVVSLLHEDISQLQDFIPVGGGLDAPGNIPHATSDRLSISGNIPLDFLGIRNGLLKPNVYWNASDLIDPVTGEHRRISNQRNINSYYNFTQDLDEWRSTWGFNWGTSFSRNSWRIAQVSRTAIHNSPFVNIFWSYKPTPEWTYTVGADNFLPYRLELQQYNYSGPRNIAGAPTVQTVFLRTEPRFYFHLRATL